MARGAEDSSRGAERAESFLDDVAEREEGVEGCGSEGRGIGRIKGKGLRGLTELGPVSWVPGELEEDVGQQGGGGVSAGKEDIDEFETQSDGGANPFREFVEEDVSALWVLGRWVLLFGGI